MSEFNCHNPDCAAFGMPSAVLVDEHRDCEMKHRRTRCIICDHEFNEWIDVPLEMLKEVFGENWEKYV